MTSMPTRADVTAEQAPRIQADGPTGGVLGQLPDLERDALGLLARSARDYGDFVRLRLGFTDAVLISHPDLIEEVLVTRNHDFQKHQGTRRLRSLLGNGLLLSEADFWLRQRRLMQPAFHRQRLAAMAEAMVATASATLNGWRLGESRDVQQEMMELTLRIVGRTLFGTDVGEDLARIRASSRVMTDHFRSRLFSLMIVLPDWVPTPGNRRYGRAVRDLDRLVYRIIAERRVSAEAAPHLLSLLLAARDETGSGMSDRQLRDEVLTLLLAGHDTTALALTWAWVLLAQHPASQVPLKAELDQVLAGRPATAADVPHLRWVDHITTETLRLYPTAWVLGREAVRDTRIGDQRLARGTTLLMSPWVVHRDRRWFDEPDAFRPERWAEGLAQRLPRFAYFPFGGGQRVCLGESFARLEANLLLATIAQRFRLELDAPDRPVEPWPVVTLRTRRGVPMTVTSR